MPLTVIIRALPPVYELIMMTGRGTR
jgi:hypothetical protein